jgi:hypothetical protein
MPMTLRSVKNASLAAAPLPSELSPDELRLSKGGAAQPTLCAGVGAVGDGEGGEGGGEGCSGGGGGGGGGEDVDGGGGSGEGGEAGSEGAVDKFGAVGSGIAEGIRTHERLHVA